MRVLTCTRLRSAIAGARSEALHLFDRLEGFALDAERQEPRPLQALGRVAALCGDITVVGAKQCRFELRIACHVRVKRARKKHLRIEPHAVHIAETRCRVIQCHATDGAMFALSVGTEFRQHVARCIRLLSAGTQGVGLERALDQPTGVEVSQTRLVVDGDGARPACTIAIR